MIFERLIERMAELKANVYRVALYEDGVWYEKTLGLVPALYQCYSLTKNFTATAVGIAQDKGLLNTDDLILKYFEKELPESYDKRLERVKIHHLLTHTAGNEEGYLFSADRFLYKDKGYLPGIFSKPLDHEAGDSFTYSNSNYYLLSLIIHRVSGLTLEAFLRKYLFGDMDIFEYAFQNCPDGETMGATGLFMSAQDLAKLGVLYLNKGVFNGKKLFSSYWSNEAARDQVKLTGASKYGYSFWIEDNGFCGKGDHGQTIVVLPDRNIALAVQGYGDFDIYSLLQTI